MKQVFRLVHAESRQNALQAVRDAEEGYVVTIAEETRNLAQNAMLWAILTDVSEQVGWYGKKLTPDEWKAVFTAALKKTKVVPGIDGGFVVVGQQTSSMTKREFAELLELILAFGSERSVKWTEQEVFA